MTTNPSRTVLLDTSFILTLTKSHRDLRDAATLGARVVLATTDGVVMELQRLARNGSFRSKGLARIALSELERNKVEVRETHPATPKVDTGIIAVALGDRRKIDVGTVDRQLSRTLSTLGVSVINLHRKNR